MSVDCMQQREVPALPPVYSDLLSSARRMRQRAQARCWASLLDEEVAFFRAYERVARHESRSVPARSSDREHALCEQVHRDVARHVAEARRLLLARQAELAPDSGSGRGQGVGEGEGEAYSLLL